MGFWLIAAAAMSVLMMPSPPPTPRKVSEVAYSEFLGALEVGKVSEVKIARDTFMFKLKNEKQNWLVRVPTASPDLIKLLAARGVKFFQQKTSSPGHPGPLLMGFAGFALYFLNKPQSLKNNVGVKFDKTRVDSSVNFNDIAGIDDSKAQVMEVVDVIKNPAKYTRVGARIPAGVLLCGPPGTGKTLLARIIAAEASLPFFSCSGSDFVEIFIGRGAARVRELFERARRAAPSIIFIDELDALGKQRGRGGGSGNDEAEQTLNQLLACMDGIDTKGGSGVVCIAATNRLDVLDEVGLPDAAGREAVLRVHTRRLPLATDVNLQVVAHRAARMSPAELAALTNEAAIGAARRGDDAVQMQDFESALEVFRGSRGRTEDGDVESCMATPFGDLQQQVLKAALMQACAEQQLRDDCLLLHSAPRTADPSRPSHDPLLPTAAAIEA